MAELAVILGSGFSKPAGLPLAREINSYFKRDNTENILVFSSGEFKWIDFANETYKINGRGGYDYYAFGILLNEFVNQFIEENKEFRNYEDFYQYIIDNLYNEKKIKDLKQNSITSFDMHFPKMKENQFHKNYTNAINYFQPKRFKSMVNHLIDDLLYIRISEKDFTAIYKTFAEFLVNYKNVDFITLNHDLLLENIITEILKDEFCDGFTTNQRILKSRKGNSLKIFKGEFCDKYNIIKLHGSIDIYQYSIGEENGSILNLTGEYIYFKTHSYEEKQSPIRHDPETDEIVQRFNVEIDPQFITGTRKKDIIFEQEIYKTLFEEFEKRMMNCKSILIIGYSFGDEHVNEIIQKAINKLKKLTKIININPSTKIPFDVINYENHHFQTIQELTLI